MKLGVVARILGGVVATPTTHIRANPGVNDHI